MDQTFTLGGSATSLRQMSSTLPNLSYLQNLGHVCCQFMHPNVGQYQTFCCFHRLWGIELTHPPQLHLRSNFISQNQVLPRWQQPQPPTLSFNIMEDSSIFIYNDSDLVMIYFHSHTDAYLSQLSLVIIPIHITCYVITLLCRSLFRYIQVLQLPTKDFHRSTTLQEPSNYFCSCCFFQCLLFVYFYFLSF